jgi:signal transduction histidine kinase
MPEPLCPPPAASSAAGELADVVVHGLSAIAIQAEAAEAVLRSDPSMAADPLATIRVCALEALADMRRLLGALRQSNGDLASARSPQPGLEQLPGLVARCCEAGQPVTLEVTGSPRALPASYQLAAFRVVQEALASAREHAPGSPTAVSVSWTDATLQIEVLDGGAGGRDLTPLQERVLLHGGRLDAEAVPGGGYRIRATFPA